MSRINMEHVVGSLVDLSRFTLDVSGPHAQQPTDVSSQVARLLGGGGPGYCIGYGTKKVLAAHGLDVDRDRETGYALLESLFRSAMARVDMSQFCVTPRAMSLGKVDVDGFNTNKAFSHDGKVEAREFMVSKCLHFDAATPFVANIYGPNQNIRGGYPLICDVKAFCRDRGVRPAALVENIPNNYNVAIKREFYNELLDDYSFAYHADVDTDIVIVMFLNEIAHGVAHGATDPAKVSHDQPARRPIRHLEYQYADESHYEEWYRYYGLEMLSAGNYAGENLSLDYHGEGRRFENLIAVNN